MFHHHSTFSKPQRLAGFCRVSLASISGFSLNAKDVFQLALSPLEVHLPLNNLSELFESGAKGNLNHLKQMAIMRGELKPSAWCKDSENPIDVNFSIDENLAKGQSADSSFAAAFSGRAALADKKLLTPSAGNITRHLMLELWDWQVITKDCMSDCTQAAMPPRSIRSCKTTGRYICSACVGEQFAKIYPKGIPNKFPIGIIAAQVIGERGTQLSMQSYKGDGQLVSPKDIMKVLKDFFKIKLDSNATALDKIRENSAYATVDRFWFDFLIFALSKPKPANMAASWFGGWQHRSNTTTEVANSEVQYYRILQGQYGSK